MSENTRHLSKTYYTFEELMRTFSNSIATLDRDAIQNSTTRQALIRLKNTYYSLLEYNKKYSITDIEEAYRRGFAEGQGILVADQIMGFGIDHLKPEESEEQ